MSTTSGRWLSVEDYARQAGIGESEAKEAVRSGAVTSKVVAGREYVWDEGDNVEGEAAGETPAAAKDPDTGREAGGDAVKGETLVSGDSWPRELALQTDRAILLVERSLNTFMMMHKEVVSEKDRFNDQSRQALLDRNQSFTEKDEKIEELEMALRSKEQEIVDLKMHVEILEGQSQRARSKTDAVTESILVTDERASVGDMMEDQLRYIMEDQMVKEILKE